MKILKTVIACMVICIGATLFAADPQAESSGKNTRVQLGFYPVDYGADSQSESSGKSAPIVLKDGRQATMSKGRLMLVGANGKLSPAPTGRYTTSDGSIIFVGGKGVALKDGRQAMISNGRLMLVDANGKPSPAPEGRYTASDGSIIFVGGKGQIVK